MSRLAMETPRLKAHLLIFFGNRFVVLCIDDLASFAMRYTTGTTTHTHTKKREEAEEH